MTITPITPAEPACFGITCPAHEHCQRYHNAEGAPHATIATCEDAAGERPLYQPRRALLVDLAAEAGHA